MFTLQTLGGVGEEGRACFLLRADRRTWLLDCGVKRTIAGDHVGEYPAWEYLDPASLDAVILTHAHEDHSAALPVLYKNGFTGTVYCTPPTAELAVEYCHTWRKTVERYGFQAPYSAEDVERVRFARCEYGEEIDLGLKVTFSPSGHLLGSAMCHLEWQGHRLLYTGDAAWESPLLADPEDPVSEVLIVDGSYGAQTFTRRTTEERLLALIREAGSRGGMTLLPLPRLGRSQDVMLLLQEESASLPPIFVEAGLREACADYARFASWLRPGAMVRLERALASPAFHWVETAAQRRSAWQTPAAVILATDAMFSNGTSVDHLHALAGSARNLIVLTGHQAPGTPGRELEQGKRDLAMAQGRLSVNARVERVTLKVHPVLSETLQLIGTNTREVFIVHSERDAADELERELRARDLPATVPALGTPYRLV